MDTHNWGHIQVPANWQMQGYDYPQYVNVKYPWEMTEDIMPPEIPRVYNPVGFIPVPLPRIRRMADGCSCGLKELNPAGRSM